MQKIISIKFILPSLRPGGAERVISYLSQNLNKSRFKCELIIIGFKKQEAYTIEDIPAVYLKKKRALTAFPSIFRILRKDRPDIVLTSATQLNIMMGLQSFFFPRIKFVGREANVNSVVKNYKTTSKEKKLLISLFSRIGYRYLNKIVCQSDDMANDFITNYNIPKSKVVIINNPISNTLKTKKKIPPLEKNCFKLITVGRMVRQKGHLRILEALSKLELPFVYTMIGDGPEKEKIMERAKELGIYESTNHIPFTTEVFACLAENHLFLQGSYVEGFPNALLESCAVGTPVLAFRAPGGIDEIIDIGVNGLLADNTIDYANKITIILKILSKWKPDIVSKSVFEKYNSKKILNSFERLFVDMLRNK